MSVFNKFNQFIEDVALGVHDLDDDTLMIMLTNDEPMADDAVKADLTEIGAVNGYAAGGNVAAFVSGMQVNGVFTLVLANPATWVAAGGAIGPFQYAVLYNSTPASKPLIGWWDYGNSISLQDTETFNVALDQVHGVLSLG